MCLTLDFSPSPHKQQLLILNFFDLSTNLANKSHHIMKSYTILSQGNSSMFSNSFSLWHNRLRHHATPIIKSTGTVVIFQRAIKWK